MSIALVPFAFFDFLTAECNMSMYVIAYGMFYYYYYYYYYYYAVFNVPYVCQSMTKSQAFPVPSNAAASLK